MCTEKSGTKIAQKPLTIALVVDSFGNKGNGTSNSALQWAHELTRQGHIVRLVGIAAPEYAAKVHYVPLVSEISARQQMEFAQPDPALFARAFDGVDIVHIYTPFHFGRGALAYARSMGLPVTAGFHVQPENITYSAGPLRFVPGIDSIIYAIFWQWLYSKVDAIHVPTELGAKLLRSHGYTTPIHVISNGYQPIFTPKQQREGAKSAGIPFKIIASGRLSHEKNHRELIQAIAMSKHALDIQLTIAGTGPIQKKIEKMAREELAWPAQIGFRDHADMPQLLRSCDLLCHPSIADLEGISVIEGMASGLVPVIAQSKESAASHFALCKESAYPVGHPEILAQRIDWWIEHPKELNDWGAKYAKHTKAHYAVEESVQEFVTMERGVIARHNLGR